MTKTVREIEPAAIWAISHLIVFDKNLTATQNVMITQGRTALHAVIQRIDRLYELINAFPQLANAYPHKEIPSLLTDICAHQGVASSILFNDIPQTDDESTRAYKLRMERFRYVKHACDSEGVALRWLVDRKVRNKLIHSSYHIEKAMRSRDTGWLIDSAIRFRNEFKPQGNINVGFCRVFIAEEEVLAHLGHEMPMKELRQEATDVLAALFSEAPTAPPALFFRNPSSAPKPPDQTGV